MDVTDQVHLLADQLRAIALLGLAYSDDKPHDADRYEQILGVAAELFALADTRSGTEVRQTVFHELTHVTPLCGAEAAVFDQDGRLLLIRRADDGLWALPGGMINSGETPAQAAVREALEETGLTVEPTALVGVYDSRFSASAFPLQLYHFVVACAVVDASTRAPTTPWEVTDHTWASESDRLELSPGHHIRVPGAFAWHRGEVPAHLDLVDSVGGGR
jgi:8-oxo-dGTP pyrophosphatase MutT (NUDIX family)